jgi:quercetin dioxygenase-like cupin family protein
MAMSRVRLLVAAAISVGGLSTLAVVRAQQPAPANEARFTGVTTVLDGKDLSAARRRFEPGARSAWHSHDNGQLLFVQEGRMRSQKRGQPIKEFGPGDSEYTAPRVEHWHGAVPQTHLIQINVGFGGETRWLQKTTDEEYNGKK